MRFYIQLIFIIFGYITIPTDLTAQRPHHVTIEVSDSTWKLDMSINGVRFQEKLTYRKIKKILGKASRIEKTATPDYPRGYRVSGGLKDFFRLRKRVRTFYYHDLGIAFRGKKRSKINSVKIYFDTTNTCMKYLLPFTGDFFINGQKVKRNLSKAITKSTGKSYRFKDPLACGLRCNLYKTRFKPSYQSYYYHQIKNRKHNPHIQLTYFMNSPEIVEAHYIYMF